MKDTTLTPAERVALLIKKLDVTTYQFGKATGISHQTLSNVLTGKNKPGLDTLQAIASVYPTAAVFLLTGEGEPFPEGRFNEKAASTDNTEKTAEAKKPEAAIGPRNGPETVSQADSVLALARAEGMIEQLQKENEWLRSVVGKPDDSSDAADDFDGDDNEPYTPTLPIAGAATPLPSYLLRVQGLRRYQE